MTRITRNLVITAVLLAASLPAWSATIYSNFGPGDSFDVPAYIIGGGSGTQQEVALSFVPAFGATLDSIRVAVRNDPFFSSANNYTIYLASDSSGLPGSAIETFSGLTFSYPSAILTLNSSANPLLSAGTMYWVVVTAPDLIASSGAWNFSDQGVMGLAARSVNSGWNACVACASPVMDVNGTSVSEIPEPSALTLTLAGLAGLLLFRFARVLLCRRDAATSVLRR